MKKYVLLVALVVILATIVACAPAPAPSSAPATTPVAIPPAAAAAPVIAVAPQRTVKFNVLIVGCADGRCLEEIAGTRTQVRYFRSIAGVIPPSFGEIVKAEEVRMGGQFDLIVVGTHDVFCTGAGCGGQEMLAKLLANPDMKVLPELVQTKTWIKANLVSPSPLQQAMMDGESAVRLDISRSERTGDGV